MEEKFIVALDQGTTSSRAILVNGQGKIVDIRQREFPQIFPAKGWVEHDAEELWRSQKAVLAELIQANQLKGHQILALGITNQRETVVAWDSETGESLYNAIVWQDQRTSKRCVELKKGALAEVVRTKTGLVIDSYFSATKMEWLLQNVASVQSASDRGTLKFGTVDSWLIWKLSEGKCHCTEVSNASRTMLFDIHKQQWDLSLLETFGINPNTLPEVKDSDSLFGHWEYEDCSIPIHGVLGDQQAALFGQCCWTEGEVKNTYGTGCFMLMNTGEKAALSAHGLLTTIAWRRKGVTHYALEGSVLVAGAAIQWLRDSLKFFEEASQTESMALNANDNELYFVPAFSGLGTPYWNNEARGGMIGITRDTGPKEIVRAALEAMGYRTAEVLECMSLDAAIPITRLKVDGGATANNYLMQFQADVAGVEVDRPKDIESTALGAAFMAGLAVGFFNEDDLQKFRTMDRNFSPKLASEERSLMLSKWKEAVHRICAPKG